MDHFTNVQQYSILISHSKSQAYNMWKFNLLKGTDLEVEYTQLIQIVIEGEKVCINFMYLSIHGVSTQYWAVQGRVPQHAQPPSCSFSRHSCLTGKVTTSCFKVHFKYRSKLFPGNFKLDRITGSCFV